jgi:hypothetical protein
VARAVQLSSGDHVTARGLRTAAGNARGSAFRSNHRSPSGVKAAKYAPFGLGLR